MDELEDEPNDFVNMAFAERGKLDGDEKKRKSSGQGLVTGNQVLGHPHTTKVREKTTGT